MNQADRSKQARGGHSEIGVKKKKPLQETADLTESLRDRGGTAIFRTFAGTLVKGSGESDLRQPRSEEGPVSEAHPWSKSGSLSCSR